jgi:hypothetical protein
MAEAVVVDVAHFRTAQCGLVEWLLSVGRIMSSQNEYPFCEFRDIMASLGDHESSAEETQ